MDFVSSILSDYIHCSLVNVKLIPTGAYKIVISDPKSSYAIEGTRGSGDTDAAVTAAIKARLDTAGVKYVQSENVFAFVGFTTGTGQGVATGKLNMNETILRQNNLVMAVGGVLLTRLL